MWLQSSDRQTKAQTEAAKAAAYVRSTDGLRPEEGGQAKRELASESKSHSKQGNGELKKRR